MSDKKLFDEIRVSKVCLNINPSSVGDQVTRASRVINQLTGQKAMLARSHRSIPKFGIRRGDKIAAYVTVRGKKAEEIMHKALNVHDYELPKSCFSRQGNFGFGIKEHIDLGLKYDRDIGIHGMDIYVVLERPGYRVRRRKHCRSRIGQRQRITQEEARLWFENIRPKDDTVAK